MTMPMDTPLLDNNINTCSVEDDDKPLNFVQRFGLESKKLWKLAAPAIFTALCQYSIGALTLTFVGQVGDLSLAAVSVANSCITGFAFRVMLFAFALNFPIQKFLQAQGKVLVMLCISAVVLVLHIFFSWLLILKLAWGLTGAAITLNTSRWVIVIAQILYVLITKSDGAWSGFTWLAFADLFSFVNLSLASAVMLCMNINGWDTMIALGFNVAIRFSVLVVSITSISIGVVAMILVLTTRDYFPYLFTTSAAVANKTTKFAALLGVTVLLNNLQPVLSGVAVGAGWQSLVAYINMGCYYVVGLPAGIVLGFTFNFGEEGIWSGMIGGTYLQTIILIVVTLITNWKREAEGVESRMRKWGGSIACDQWEAAIE